MLCQRWMLRGKPTSRRRGTSTSSSRPRLKLQTRFLPSGAHYLQKEKKRLSLSASIQCEVKLYSGTQGSLPAPQGATPIQTCKQVASGIWIWVHEHKYAHGPTLEPKCGVRRGNWVHAVALDCLLLRLSLYHLLPVICVLERRHSLFLLSLYTWVLALLGRSHTETSFTLDVLEEFCAHVRQTPTHHHWLNSKELFWPVASRLTRLLL